MNPTFKLIAKIVTATGRKINVERNACPQKGHAQTKNKH